MQLLDKIQGPEDLKKLTLEELNQLSSELRHFLIEVVSANGGHLAPSLGVVELTIALHYAFQTPKDHIIWDVGHQAYVHKILTGRKDRMQTLRQLNGLSGFPNISESEYDHYTVGHSSTSLSLAIGDAVARDLKGEKYEVVPVIGDGAMTAGLAYEALNLMGGLKNKVIIILNDNSMSISPNVGGISHYLNRLIANPTYNRLKVFWYRFLHSIPLFGKRISQVAREMEWRMKHIFIPGIFFEELGIRYIGPIDGHNISDMIELFSKIKEIESAGPLLVHIVTKKGMGYKHAEDNAEIFHGLGPFEKDSGKIIKNTSRDTVSLSGIFGSSIVRLAKNDDKIVAITAAMREGTGLKKFSLEFPDRFFDVGIAEQNAVTFAAALAAQGMKPYVAIYSTFLQRSIDQIIHDLALMRLPVRLVIDRAGVVGEDGPTHHGVFDIALLRPVPNLVLMAPKDGLELELMVEFMNQYNAGPIAIRFPRGSEMRKLLKRRFPYKQIELGCAEVLSSGKDLLILTYGFMYGIGLKIRRKLKRKGFSIGLVNLRFLKPLDIQLIIKEVEKSKTYIVIEDGSLKGGVAEEILSQMPGELRNREIGRFGYGDVFIPHGTREQIMALAGVEAAQITDFVLSHKLFTDIDTVNIRHLTKIAN